MSPQHLFLSANASVGPGVGIWVSCASICLHCGFFCFFVFFVLVWAYFGQAYCMQKFLDQGSNLHHSSNPSHCSDNAQSLACYATRGLPHYHLFKGMLSGERKWLAYVCMISAFTFPPFFIEM